MRLGDLEAEETAGEANLERINWPRRDAEKTWADPDCDLSSIMQTTMGMSRKEGEDIYRYPMQCKQGKVRNSRSKENNINTNNPGIGVKMR